MTHTHTHWLMGGKEEEEHIPNWPSFFCVSACVHTCARVCACVVVLFWVCAFHVEWLPVRACCKAPEPNHFSSPSLPPSACCCSALCSPATIQFNWIPTGIQLKFLPNNQLNKQKQTACLQSSLARCQRAVECLDLKMTQKSNNHLNALH